LVECQLEKLKKSNRDKAPYGEPPNLLEKQISEACTSINQAKRALINIKGLAEQIERRAA